MHLLASQNNEHVGISRLLAQMMNKFCVERDFSVQEASHQLLPIPMVECSRVFETIKLIQELSVTQVIEVRVQMRLQGRDTKRSRWSHVNPEPGTYP
jgi:hypothetical protein